MEYDVFNQYPDYLQDFDIIKSLLAMQWEGINSVTVNGRTMLKYLKFVYQSGGIWDDIITVPDGKALGKMIKILLKRHEVVHFDDVLEFVSAWISSSGFELEYHKDSMTMTLRVDKGYYLSGVYERIRDFIPCNMVLAVEIRE